MRRESPTVRLDPVFRGESTKEVARPKRLTSEPRPAPEPPIEEIATTDPGQPGQGLGPLFQVAVIRRYFGNVATIGSASSGLPVVPRVNMITGGDRRTADLRLAEATGKIVSGEIDEGRELLLSLVRDQPDAPEAPQALLEAARVNPDLNGARRELRWVIENYSAAAEAIEALERLGELSFILGEYDESVASFSAFRQLEDDPGRVRQANIRVALGLLRSDRFEEARNELEALPGKYADLRDSPEIMEGLADSLLALGEYEEADRLLERIETRFPNHGFAGKVLLSRGLSAELQGRSSDAGRFYEAIIEHYPGSLEAPLALERLRDLSRPIVAASRRFVTRP